MKLYLAPEIVRSYPEYVMFTIVARGIDNHGSAEPLQALLAAQVAKLRQDPRLTCDARAHPRIASWREAFRRFGADPDAYPPSLQNLVEMALAGREVPFYNPVVALSNYIALEYMVPSGTDDLAKVAGDFGIRTAYGDEIYVPIGGNEVEPVPAGEVIYADERKVMCRRWIWRQGEHTKVTAETRDVTMNIDILPPATRAEGEQAVRELMSLLREYCGGDISYNVLDRHHTQEEVAAASAVETYDNVYDLLEMRGYVRRTSDREGTRRLLGGATTIYQGFDPTADSLHIGHLLSLMVFRHLQNAGHRMIFLLGAGTAQVGDPTGKTRSRRVLDMEEIERNKEAIRQQVQSIGLADFERDAPGRPKALMLNNAEWLNMSLFDYLRGVALYFSVNRMLRMETFAQRLETQEHLSLFEFLYPTLQGFDFWYLHRRYGCQLQVGGDDQWTNILAGAELISRRDNETAYAMTFGLLLDASGQKMGKTAEGEAIWLEAARTSPFAFYQYWVNTPDADLRRLFRLFTFLPLAEIEEVVPRAQGGKGDDPRAAQRRLAYEVTKIVHGEEAARRAQEDALRAFGAGAGLPEDVPTLFFTPAELQAGVSLIDAIAGAPEVDSKSEARRLIKQGAVRVNDEKTTDVNRILTSGDLMTIEGQQAIVIRYRKSRVLKVVVR